MSDDQRLMWAERYVMWCDNWQGVDDAVRMANDRSGIILCDVLLSHKSVWAVGCYT